MICCTVAPLPTLSDEGPQQAMVRQFATGSVYGPEMVGTTSWMPNEISWYMWRCDCPVPAIRLVTVVRLGGPVLMSNIIAAMVRGVRTAVPMSGVSVAAG